MYSPILAVLVTFLLASSSLAFPSGAPDEACRDLDPKHDNSTSSDNNDTKEYVIAVTPGHKDQYYVVLGGPDFKGFVLRVDGGKLDYQDNNAQAMLCPEPYQGITHISIDDKKAIVASWIPESSGTFTFNATVVKNFESHVIGISKVFTVEEAAKDSAST